MAVVPFYYIYNSCTTSIYGRRRQWRSHDCSLFPQGIELRLPFFSYLKSARSESTRTLTVQDHIAARSIHAVAIAMQRFTVAFLHYAPSLVVQSAPASLQLPRHSCHGCLIFARAQDSLTSYAITFVIRALAPAKDAAETLSSQTGPLKFAAERATVCLLRYKHTLWTQNWHSCA